jgi:HTH-type transcriptional regulator/antitoxin HigA
MCRRGTRTCASRRPISRLKEALIPRAEWDAAKLTRTPSYARISAFAQRLGVHQAIVAGRIRYETKDYRKFAQLLGTGEVSRLMAEQK